MRECIGSSGHVFLVVVTVVIAVKTVLHCGNCQKRYIIDGPRDFSTASVIAARWKRRQECGGCHLLVPKGWRAFRLSFKLIGTKESNNHKTREKEDIKVVR